MESFIKSPRLIPVPSPRPGISSFTVMATTGALAGCAVVTYGTYKLASKLPVRRSVAWIRQQIVPYLTDMLANHTPTWYVRWRAINPLRRQRTLVATNYIENPVSIRFVKPEVTAPEPEQKPARARRSRKKPRRKGKERLVAEELPELDEGPAPAEPVEVPDPYYEISSRGATVRTLEPTVEEWSIAAACHVRSKLPLLDGSRKANRQIIHRHVVRWLTHKDVCCPEEIVGLVAGSAVDLALIPTTGDIMGEAIRVSPLAVTRKKVMPKISK